MDPVETVGSFEVDLVEDLFRSAFGVKSSEGASQSPFLFGWTNMFRKPVTYWDSGAWSHESGLIYINK